MYDKGISVQEIKDGKINRVTWTGIAVDSVLMSLKLIAGIAGTSGAMIAGATHTFSDLAADIVTLLGFNAPRDFSVKRNTHTRGEFETLIAISIGVAVFYAGMQIFFVGMSTVYNSYYGKLIREPGWIAFYASIFSILIKEWLYRFTVKKSLEIECPEIITKARNHRADVFSSIVSMLGIGGAIMIGGKWRLLDPLASVIISLFIFKAAIDIAKTGIGEFGKIYASRKKDN